MKVSLWFLVYLLGAFLIGALPFSVWLGRIFLKKDIRNFGDGNPGAISTIRAGGRILGIIVMLLDITKGILPTLFAVQVLGYSGLPLIVFVLAPVLGHAYSPFLGFKGGKAIAVTFGTWIGLTIWQIPVVALIAVLIGKLLLDSDAWVVMIAFACMLIAIILWSFPDSYILIICLQWLLVSWKHREQLRRPPHFKSVLRK